MNNNNITQIILIFFKYFWALAIVVTCFNAVITSLHMEEATANERRKMMIGLAFWMNVPWIVMGICPTIGGVPSLWHYLRPRDCNPFVLVWWAVVLVLYIIGSYWIFFGGGATKLAKFGVIRSHSLGKTTAVHSDTGVKLIFLLFLTGGLITGVILWFVNIPLPSFIK